MATRGARPKPAALRLVTGTNNTTRHGKPGEAAAAVAEAQAASGKPERPSDLKGQAAGAWARFIAPAAWLDASREGVAIAFCEAWQEFRDGPRLFPGSKHGQMRAYMAELGLTDERNRKADDGKPKDPADEFF